MTGQINGLMANPFHEAAISYHRVGVVVEERISEPGIQNALGDSHANGIGQTLAKRPCCGLNAWHMTVFGMSRGLAPDLTETFQVIDRNSRVSGQIEDGIEQ